MTELLSLVVPVYFEEECIEQFVKETKEVLIKLDISHEIIFVDDGSKDGTVEKIRKMAASDGCLKLIEFSYNHGKQIAVTAGIFYAKGDFILYMDPDLQDPPDEIPRFLSEIRNGYDLVFGVRRQKLDSWKNVLMSKLFWFILEKFTGLKIPRELAVMRIFNRRFANQFNKYPERNRFIEGMFMHIGLRQTSLIIDQRKRFAGISKFSFKRKIELAFSAILDYSELPLKAAVRLGFLISVLGILFTVIIIVRKFLITNFQAGWPSIISIMITGFGLQMFFLGIVALYVGRLYREAKGRPLYSIKNTVNLI